MHFWRQREITDRLIAERAARRERMEQIDNAKLMAAMLGAAWNTGREYDPELITQTWVWE